MMKKILFVLFLLLCVAVHAQQRATIAPLLQTQWGQGSPYNLLCPTKGGQHCQTGCVATAMAQVMRFHEWPKDGFAWSKMQNTYAANTPATDESALAVAELMAACGKAVNMDYGVSTSAAWEGDAAVALVETYGYAKSVREVFRNMYGRMAWENLLYHELAQGHPVMYGGLPSGFVHQFVCDGYAEGKFHFNMAWQFMADGHYTVDELDRFPEGQSAIIGIAPTCTEDFGVTFSERGLTFTVTDAGEVSVRMDSQQPLTGELLLPDEVTHGGKTYRVTAIEYAAFEDCEGITRLSIPASVAIIGRRAVLGCTNLTAIEVAEENPYYRAEDGVLTDRANELLAYPIAREADAYCVPEGVTDIPASLFRGNTHLERLELPSGLKSIDILAFRGCTGLKEVVCTNRTPQSIEDMAFDDDTYATATLYVPEGTAASYRKLAGWRKFQHIKEGVGIELASTMKRQLQI